jgi:hypothetical protein
MSILKMNVAIASGLALTLAATAEARKPELPPYPEALRCAVLTAAYMRQVPTASKEGLDRFDKAMFWGFAASEAARNAKLPGGQLDKDIDERLKPAQAELKARDARAKAELKDCLKRVPPLPKKKRKG